MKDWELRQKHYQETTKALVDSGAMVKGRLVAWNPKIAKALKDSGHTSVDILPCSCHKGQITK